MADPELQIRGGVAGHPVPEIGGGWSPKNFFAALRASVWSTNKCVCVCVCVCVGGGGGVGGGGWGGGGGGGGIRH